MIVAASSVHRQPAIEAVAHAIDMVKETVTIWKKVSALCTCYVVLFNTTVWFGGIDMMTIVFVSRT